MVALLVPVVEEEEEVEAEEEESVTLLHPALAEAADLDASLVGFAVLPSVRLGRDPAVLLRPGSESAFFRFWIGEAPAAPLFLLWPRPDDAGGSETSDRFFDLAGPFLVSEVLSLGGGSDLGFLAGVGPKVLIWSGASLRFSPRVPSLFDWWPGRSCSDVPAASGSSCNTNEATDRVRPLLLELCPLDWPVAELAVALEALELGLLFSGGEFALCFTCSDCNLPATVWSCGWAAAVFLCERRSDPPGLELGRLDIGTSLLKGHTLSRHYHSLFVPVL